MESEHDDAVSHLGGLALGQVLEDLGVVGNESDLQRMGLGGSKASSNKLDRKSIYRNDFDDDLEAAASREDAGDERMQSNMLVREGDAAEASAQRHTYESVQPHIRGESDDFDDAESDAKVPLQRAPAQEAPMSPRSEARLLFPNIEPGAILNFTDMFATKSSKRRRLVGKPLQPYREPPPEAISEVEVLSAPGTEHGLRPRHNLVMRLAQPYMAGDEKAAAKQKLSVSFDDDASERASGRPSQFVNNVENEAWDRRALMARRDGNPGPSLKTINSPWNDALASGMWLESIIWHSQSESKPFDQLIMDMNDPEMILENEKSLTDTQKSLLRKDAPPSLLQKHSKYAQELDKFNLSNDRMYEVSKEQRHRVRQTLGQLVVRHAWPAVKLQLPFYKTRLSKHETRSWHRPAIQFPANTPLTFSKVRSAKKSKDGEQKKSKDPTEVLRSTRDLTLKDASGFVLCEYSEEYPPLLSNLGMGNLIVNYYRKKDNKDDHIPRADLGEAYVLDVTDESPFMKFGGVEPGQTQTVLYNNMTRAPLFRHKASQNDFLFIRSTTKNDVRYYLRDVKNMFVVGQTYPTTPIPGPHARLVTNNIKYRLQMIAYKLVEKSHAHRIKIHRVMKYFPDQNELQMRQRLKEFMVYHRSSGDKHQSFWRLKPNVPIPDEAELQKLLTPEHICLVEGMQVGQRHLLDAGFSKTAEGADADSDETKMDIEQLLAPWITSKNFLHATQGKAMLKLHGDGDPSGRGEAFSFVRVSMKEIFLRAGEDVDERLAAEAEARAKSGHRYNVAEQQAIYRSEIDRIWRAQLAALSNPVPPRLAPREEREWREERRKSEEKDAKGAKPLLIKRLIDGVWYKQVVRNAAVVNAYVKQRQEIEEQSIVTESLRPTGDASLDAIRRKRLEEEIAARVKNQDRRLQRKNAKAAAEGVIGGYRKMPNKTNTKRRCGRCGQVGHMLTNNNCPQYSANDALGRPAPGRMGSASSSVRPPSVMPMPNSTYYTNTANQQPNNPPSFSNFPPGGAGAS